MQTFFKQYNTGKRSGRSSLFFSLGCCLLLIFASTAGIRAQDPVFSQFNMLPSQNNPAFVGNTYAPLIHINSRMQWPSINLAYNTVAVSYDQYFHRMRSAFGLSILNDREGNGIFSHIKIQGLYAYRLKVKDEHFIKMGLSLAFVQKRLNWEKLVFPDQVDPEYGSTDEQGQMVLSDENKPDELALFYPDLGVGMLYYSPYFYAGLAIEHANNPDQNFLNANLTGQNSLSNLYSLQLGAQWPLAYYFKGEQVFLQPALYYAHQEGLGQLNMHVMADMGMIYAGIGYRHAMDNPDAAIFHLGFESGMYKLGYSYDLTVSRLTSSSGGSHELGLIINFDSSEWFEKPGKYSDCFEIFR